MNAMIVVDDRTESQKTSHNWLVVGTDSFLSGWGKAANGASFAAWASTYEQLDEVYKWVSSRKDMKRVRIVKANTYRPKCAHLHIYVYDK